MFQAAPDWLTQCESRRAQSPHAGGINAGMADGSVHWFTAGTDDTLWANLCDPRDGNAVSF